jgi:hypothetical protein
MGQQQLLLLVLSTVIVGLATVAGIQAFSEGQQQATQDALVQRATSIGSDLMSAHNTPTQMGGTDLTDGTEASSPDISGILGVEDATDIPAEGAGSSAACSVDDSADPVTIDCGSTGPTSGDVKVTVQVDPDTDTNDDEVTVTSIDVTS